MRGIVDQFDPGVDDEKGTGIPTAGIDAVAFHVNREDEVSRPDFVHRPKMQHFCGSKKHPFFDDGRHIHHRHGAVKSGSSLLRFDFPCDGGTDPEGGAEKIVRIDHDIQIGEDIRTRRHECLRRSSRVPEFVTSQPVGRTGTEQDQTGEKAETDSLHDSSHCDEHRVFAQIIAYNWMPCINQTQRCREPPVDSCVCTLSTKKDQKRYSWDGIAGTCSILRSAATIAVLRMPVKAAGDAGIKKGNLSGATAVPIL